MVNAGTIPDRGLYGVFVAGSGDGKTSRRVGELDEEMVYEARQGQTFMLGASTWRIEEITRDRVLVSPAPGIPGAVPFWKGEGVGRPYELGQAIGRTTRELASLDDAAAEERLRTEHALDRRAARNLVTFLREQEGASALPSDRTIVCERFRDEIGDWRVCVLTPFGARVHAPWALATAADFSEKSAGEIETLWSDDGMVFRFPESDDPPDVSRLFPKAHAVEELLIKNLGQSSLFAARFRENAARALLLPRRHPGRRSPLWAQRKRSADLLAVASRYGSFPILLETYRECLRDVFDVPALVELVVEGSSVRQGELDPEAATLDPGPELYFELMRGMAQSLRECLGGSS